MFRWKLTDVSKLYVPSILMVKELAEHETTVKQVAGTAGV
jgi:hypothetical protein